MMNTNPNLRRLLLSSAASLMLSPMLIQAADEAPKVEKKTEIHVMHAKGDPKMEKDVQVWVSRATALHQDAEPVTFLGVETLRVSSTLKEQLGLDRGIGLVVLRVVEDTAAAAALKKHDILLKLDDQLLVSADQLGVLVRSKEAGTSVTLTFVRGGKQQTADVVLQERKASEHQIMHLENHGDDHTMVLPGSWSGRVEALKGKLPGIKGEIERADVDRLLSKLGPKSGEGFAWVSEGGGPVVRMINNINRGNVMFSDDDGVIELLTNGDKKVLIVKSPAGEVIFDGPVNTEAERKALDDAIRLRLEKVEGIETLEFSTDEDFEAEDVRVLSPNSGSVRVIRQGENHPMAVPSNGA